MRCAYLSVLVVALTAPPFRAAEVDYLRDVKPLLKQNCYRCHGASQQKSGLSTELETLKVQQKEQQKSFDERMQELQAEETALEAGTRKLAVQNYAELRAGRP